MKSYENNRGIPGVAVFGSRALVAAVLSAALLSACGGGGNAANKEKVASQTAAKVNKEELTVHQINFLLQQQRGLQPAQAASAGRVALERLIDQEVMLQKAEAQKLDRDPRVVAQLEAARRDIIARAYLEKIGSQAPKPSPDEVKAYYDKNPGLFKDRRIYNLQEIAIEVKPEQLQEVRAKLESAKDVSAFVDYLKSAGFKFGTSTVTRAAEQLPLGSVAAFSKVKDGQAMIQPTQNGAQVIVVAATKSEPVDLDRARPAIEQFLFNERKRQVIEDDTKALRGAAKIEYVGDYARTPAEIAAATAAAASAASANQVRATTSPLVSTPASAIEPVIPVPAPIASGAVLDRGLTGLK